MDLRKAVMTVEELVVMRVAAMVGGSIEKMD